MSMIRTFLFFILLISFKASAQVRVSPHSRLFFQPKSFGFISELPPAPPEVVGSSFYSETYATTDFFLRDNTRVDRVQSRWNISDQNFEIMHEGKVKMLPGTAVMSFQWISEQGQTEVFVKNTYYSPEGIPVKGFFRILTEEKSFNLVERPWIEKLSANYNRALDVGTKDHQLVRKSTLYILKDNLALEVKGSRKRFAESFKKSFRVDVRTMLKEFDISLKKTEDLVKLVSKLEETSVGTN